MRYAPFLYIEVIVFFLLCAASVVGTLPLQKEFDARVQAARDAWIAKAENALGKKIHYTNAGFSLFNLIDLRNIQFVDDTNNDTNDDSNMDTESGYAGDSKKPTGGGLPDIAIERIRVPYSLAALLGGGGTDAVSAVIIDSPMVVIDGGRTADFIKGGSADGNETVDPAVQKKYSDVYKIIRGLVSSGFKLKVRGGSVVFKTDNLDVSVNDIYINLVNTSSINIKGRAAVSAGGRAAVSAGGRAAVSAGGRAAVSAGGRAAVSA
ncbi:MAG: hypothetical protein LBD20_06430, partial [Spirochaetaceae bacterium]|nr:hypothetical protein [Spirochaetaceae bacterium]